MTKILLWLIELALAIMMFGSQYAPGDVHSNLAHWYSLFSNDVPAWLHSVNTDWAVFSGALLVLLGIGAWLYCEYRRDCRGPVFPVVHREPFDIDKFR